jgi:DNA helicase-2/ATP-dependent DNA helicase PcrA
MPSILDDLTPQQHAAAVQPGPTLVIAGAGTGKTKTLTAAVAHRIANLKVEPARILAVTFTNKAAAEMNGRIKLALGETMAPKWAGTFHGLGARQLRIEPEVADLRSGFDILDADDSRRMVKRVMKAMNLASGDEEGGGGRDPIKTVCNRISKWKDELVIPRDAPAAAEAAIVSSDHDGFPVDPNTLRSCARVYIEYQRMLQDANAADFGDLLLWPVRAMMQDRTYRERWADRFDRVLADEYQDVNRAQYTWLRLLSAGHKEIFAVGDDDQSIFGWRGADIKYIRRFTQDFPGAAQVRLEENFRSTGHILAAANGIIGRDHHRLGKPPVPQLDFPHFRRVSSYVAVQKISSEAMNSSARSIEKVARPSGPPRAQASFQSDQ